MSEHADPIEPRISLSLTDPMIFPLVPVAARELIKLLWLLNNRLAEMAVSGKEPALRQIRLRWWADQLLLTENGTAPHEPLLADVAIRLTPLVGGAFLARLAEAWMEAAAREAGTPLAEEHGAILFGLSARLLGMDDAAAQSAALNEAGRIWAAVSCLDAVGPSVEADWEGLAHRARPMRFAGLARAIAALAALARSIALRRGERRWRSEQLLVLRVGLIGR